MKITRGVIGALLLGGLAHFGNPAVAQQTAQYSFRDKPFQTGLGLIDKEKYAAAQASFKPLLPEVSRWDDFVSSDAQYYAAVSAIELFNKDAEWMMKEFVSHHPESPKIRQAYFYLARYHYRRKKYAEAESWFQKLDVSDIEPKEQDEFRFKRGYTAFEQNNWAQAKTDLAQLKDRDTKFTAPARYYYGHMAYVDGNREAALAEMLKLEKDEVFGSVVPHYIAQIYFLQKKFDQVIAYAPALLDSANPKRSQEIARIVGESYYQTNQFQAAIPYLQKAMQGKRPTREDYYQLGYAYYKTGVFTEASTMFGNCASMDSLDALAQNALYHLADASLKSNNKAAARSAFEQAASVAFDKDIQEESLFNFAKLSYDISLNPYNDSRNAFLEYIKQYPQSIRLDEAYTYLVNLHVASRNYAEALTYLENIKKLSAELKAAYQRVAYYRGVELFQSQPEQAIAHFQKSLNYKLDKQYSALAYFWTGEANFNLGNLPEAEDYYSRFLAEPGAYSAGQFNDAHYNLGYVTFQQKNYNGAISWFRKYITFRNTGKDIKVADALNRLADAYYMSRDYMEAADYYQKAIDLNSGEVDYALYQRAVSNGILKAYGAKVADLTKLLERYPNSTYSKSARYELGKSYVAMNQPEKALNQFKQIYESDPLNPYANKALSQAGLVYYNLNQDEKALALFDQLIKKSPNSDEANDALEFVKKIYSEKGDVNGLQQAMTSYGGSIEESTLDSIAFRSAKNRYLEKECAKAITEFNSYLNRFPDGKNILDAAFFKADCELKAGNFSDALGSFHFILNKPTNPYTEQAFTIGADLALRLKLPEQAIQLLSRVESEHQDPTKVRWAQYNLLKLYQQANTCEQILPYAEKVLHADKASAPEKQEAALYSCKCLIEAEKYEEAYKQIQPTAFKSMGVIGAESMFQLAYLQYLRGDFKDCEKTIFALIDKEPDQEKWISEGLLLLSDSYMARGDRFQAKHTLKTIVENSEEPSQVDKAKNKLMQIEEKEKTEPASLHINTAELEVRETQIEYQNLFHEAETIPGGTHE